MGVLRVIVRFYTESGAPLRVVNAPDMKPLPGLDLLRAVAIAWVMLLTQMVVGARLEGSPILALLVYGDTALAAGALLYAPAERTALIVRDPILTPHRRTTLVPHLLQNTEHAADLV